MPSQFLYSSISNISKLLCITLIILFDLGASYAQAESPRDSFRGTFSVDPSKKPNSDKDSPIYPSIIFSESNGSGKYGVYAPFLYFKPSPQSEYIIDGIFVQKHLPENPKSGDYTRIALLAWPWHYTDPGLYWDIKKVADWIKRNPEKPLLLITSLRRAEASPMQNRQPNTVEDKIPPIRAIKKIEPIYPQAAKQRRRTGAVWLNTLINEKGTVEMILPIGGDPDFIPAAIAAVQHWEYSPMLINGAPVPVVIIETVRFRLDK